VGGWVGGYAELMFIKLAKKEKKEKKEKKFVEAKKSALDGINKIAENIN